MTDAMRLAVEKSNVWFVYLFTLMSVVVIVLGLYGFVSYKANKKLRVILEMLLSDASLGSEKENEGSTIIKT